MVLPFVLIFSQSRRSYCSDLGYSYTCYGASKNNWIAFQVPLPWRPECEPLQLRLHIHTYIHTFIPYTQRFLIHDVAQSDGLALQCSDIFESISKVEGCTKMRSKVGLELSCLYYISWSSTRVTRSELHSAAMAKCISNLTKGFEQKLGTDL